MKLLNICVPTYNRHEDLTHLNNTFFAPALDAYENVVEITVCDNSDVDVAIANKAMLDPRVKYRKNPNNLGFAGNLLRCVDEASACFVWVISDNDPIIWSGFEALMVALPRLDAEGVDGVMLPIRTDHQLGYSIVSNRAANWCRSGRSTMIDLLTTGQAPFVLFSSIVTRVRDVSVDVRQRFMTNDYLQIVLFASMLGVDSPIEFLDTPVINYKPEYKARYSLYSAALSMTQVRQYLHEKYGMVSDEHGDYHGWLLWQLHHQGGKYQFKGADQDRWKFLVQLHHHLSPKNIVIATALVLPGFIVRPFYLFYCTYMDMRHLEKKGFPVFISALRSNFMFIRENRRRLKSG